MPDQLERVWVEIKDSLWFVPATITIGAGLLAFLTVWADSRIRGVPQIGDIYVAFEGSVEGARGVLDAIAGTMITVTGVVFSLTPER